MIYMLVILLLIISGLIYLLCQSRTKHSQAINDEKEKQTNLLETIKLLQTLFTSTDNLDDLDSWSKDLCELLKKSFKAADVLLIQATTPDKHDKHYRIIANTTSYQQWGTKTSEPLEGLAFESDISKHFFYSNQSHIIQANDLPSCLPETNNNPFSSALAASLKILKHSAYLIILRHDKQNLFSTEDKSEFDNCIQVVNAGFAAMNYYKLSQELEQAISSAHEEGMLQISTGIIHNIGNGMAVLKIALENLQNVCSVTELTSFLKQELLPAIDQQLNDVEADKLKPTAEYLNAIREIADNINNLVEEHQNELDFIRNKFQNVIEIITLQQQFIGELGTENVVTIKSVLADTIKMIETPIEESDISLKQNFDIDADVLVDPALLRQVMLTIFKHSVHSINMAHRNPATLEISASLVEPEKGKAETDAENSPRKIIFIKINDNGYGIEFNPESKLAPQSQSAQQHRELLFCKNKIEKYGGSFHVKSTFGNGSSVIINLPIYTGDGATD